MLIPITIGVIAGLRGFIIPGPTPPPVVFRSGTVSLPVSSGLCFGISGINSPDNGVYTYSANLSALFPVGQVPVIFSGDAGMPYPFYRLNNPLGQTFLTFDRTTTEILTTFTLQTDFRMIFNYGADGLWINCLNTQSHGNTGFMSASALWGLDYARGEQGVRGALSVYIPDDYNDSTMRFHYRQSLTSDNVDIGSWTPFDPSEGNANRLITRYAFNGTTLNTDVTAIRDCNIPGLSTVFTTSFTTTDPTIAAFNPRVGYGGITGGIDGYKDVGNIVFTSPEFTPTSLSGLFLWNDAADTSTLGFVSGSTTRLSAWIDKSGFSRNFIQDGVTYTTGNSYPRYLTANQSQSNRACIAISAAAQYFDANALFFVNNKSTDFNAVSSTYTLFVVTKNNSGTNGIKILSKAGNTTPRRLLDTSVGYNGVNVAAIGQGGDPDNVSFSVTSPTNLNAYTFRWNSTTSFDGGQNSRRIPGTIAGTPVFGTNSNPLSLGVAIGFNTSGGINYHAESTFNAEICEIILYNRTLTDGEVAIVNTYLISKWSIPREINYLAIAGGGSGGVYSGGGAGGVVYSSHLAAPGVYNITVGEGGPSTFTGSSALNIDGNGRNSSIIGTGLTAIAIGGGAGATVYTANSGGQFFSGGWTILRGASGGSGGGSGGNSNGAGVISIQGGQGVPGQGFKGGDGASVSCTPSGPGGGAGGPGVNNFNSLANNPGGIGIINPIAGSTIGQLSGSSYWIAGGGAGASNACSTTIPPASGGMGGGGRSQGAGALQNSAPTSGTPNTGGGGGGGWSLASGAGGSGAVVISYISPIQYATGGTVTSFTSGSNTFWIHTFTTNGTFTIQQ